jgi:alanine dehydrogenase
MIIGIPKEILAEERRISLTAQGVYSLVKEGHKVYIEKGAGLDSRFSDDDFQKMGGRSI